MGPTFFPFRLGPCKLPLKDHTSDRSACHGFRVLLCWSFLLPETGAATWQQSPYSGSATILPARNDSPCRVRPSLLQRLAVDWRLGWFMTCIRHMDVINKFADDRSVEYKGGKMVRPAFRIDQARLRAVREEQGLSQATVARKVASLMGRPVTDSLTRHYQRIEDTGQTSSGYAKALAEVLSTSVPLLQCHENQEP